MRRFQFWGVPLRTGHASARRVSRRASPQAEQFEVRVLPSANPVVLDIKPGPDSSNVQDTFAYQGYAFFLADDGIHGQSLFRSDGTEAGTQLVQAGSQGFVSPTIVPGTGRLFFLSGNTDGFASDLWTMATPLSAPEYVGNFAATLEIAAVGQYLYLTGASGQSIWSIDSTLQATHLGDFTGSGPTRPGVYQLTPVGSQMYFIGSQQVAGVVDIQQKLWTTDGTVLGTHSISVTPDDPDHGQLNTLISSGGQLYFTRETQDGVGNDTGSQLFQFNSANNTAQLTQQSPTYPGLSIEASPFGGAFDSVVAGEAIYFFASDDANGTRLWAAGNTSPHPIQYANPQEPLSNFQGFTVAGDQLFFRADSPLRQAALWVVSSEGTISLMRGGLTLTDATRMTASGGRLWFSATTAESGAEVWTSDGTPAGTFQVGESQPLTEYGGGVVGSSPSFLVSTGTRLFYSATASFNGESPGNELWTMDISTLGQPPVASDLSLTIPDYASIGTVVGQVTASDPDGGALTYVLVNSTGNNLFQVNSGTGAISIANNESLSKASYPDGIDLLIEVMDSGSPQLVGFSHVHVTFANAAPTALALSGASVAENIPVGTVVGTFSTTDPDVGSTFTYTLAAGTGSADNGSFTIVGNQLKTNAVFDYETKKSYSIRVRVTDNSGLTLIKIFTINVTNVNEAPKGLTLSSTVVEDNQLIGTTAGTFGATDSDAGSTFTYMLAAGTGSTDNGSFTIVGNQLKTGEVFNAAVKSSYSIRVRVTDNGGLTFIKIFTITVVPKNLAPTGLALSSTSIEENKPVGTTVGTFSATDPNVGSTFTYMLAAGTGSTDNGSFTIVGNQLKTSEVFNAAVKSSYSIRVRVTDNGGLTLIKIFTIAVNKTNHAPTMLALSSTSIPENQAVGSTVGTFTATDPDAGNTFTYTLATGTGSIDNGSFTIVGNQLKTNAVFDFETKKSYSIRARVTDNGGLTLIKIFTISVTNLAD